MRKLGFSYECSLHFSVPVREHSYALRILPATDREQGIYGPEYEICGESRKSFWTDGFGNQVISGCVREPHDEFYFRVNGIAFVDRRPENRARAGAERIYLAPTPLTRQGKRLREFYADCRPGADVTGEERVCRWMDALSAAFIYEPGVTGIQTTAEEALEGGRGVCQDYAHILLALLRMDRIPARYVAGLLYGEGATHAWCEAVCDGRWVGVDPTHDRILNDEYIKLAHGRDYGDCILDRGRFLGLASQTQEVYAKVTELTPPKENESEWRGWVVRL